MSLSIDDLLAENERLKEALVWIEHIANSNYEEDHTLRARGARTLKRIADRADTALNPDHTL